MPAENPEECVGEEARAVATYMYHEFYSLPARHRQGLGPMPRVELARLTVPQYQNAVADLVASFTPPPPEAGSADQPGLRAEYFQSNGMNKADKLKQERVDTRLEFNFKDAGPTEDTSAAEFAIIWEGSLRTDDTGYHEFRVSTQNGARLYLNFDPQRRRGKLRDDSSDAGQAALIDAWVSSGQMREHTTRVLLLGGRTYPIRLEFFKYKEKDASIRFEWKPPHGVWSVLDGEHLVTASSPRTFVVETPFPADDRSVGYERGSAVSREWHQAISDSAVAVATDIINRLPYLLSLDEESGSSAEKLREFAGEFATVAFRRPLLEEERQMIVDQLFAGAPDAETGLRRAMLYVLTSPYFVYADLAPSDQPLSSHTVAARLALTLWDSLPDQALREAASRNELLEPDQVRAQAERMLADPRARQKMRGFFHQWLQLDERDLVKDRELFPGFDDAVVADLRVSLEKFVDHVVWSEASDYRQLLLADYLMLNDRLTSLYSAQDTPATDATTSDEVTEVDAEAVSDFAAVSFSPEERAGVLTHPYLLSALAYHNTTSPIQRGVFLTRNIVGRSLKPPPMAIAFKNDDFPPDLTMREKITRLTGDQACMSCHSVINPLGFALENYDAVGRWRTADGEKPVDSKSQYVTEDGETLEVGSARDIASFAVANEAAHRAFVTQLFYHLIKQPPAAYGPETPESLRLEFCNDNYHIQHLMVRIATLAALHHE
jgi:hypothetical protein